MRYLENKSEMGVKPVPTNFVRTLVEGNGFSYTQDENVEDVIFYKSGEDVYRATEEIFESEDGQLYAKIDQLDVGLYGQLQESELEIDNIAMIGDEEFQLDETMIEVDGEYYAALHPTAQEELEVLTVEGREFTLVDSEEEASFVAYLKENEDGEYELVENEDEADFYAFVNEMKYQEEDEEEEPKKKKPKQMKKGKKGKKDC